MAERIRLNPLGGTGFQAPKTPQLPMPGAQPVHMASRVPGAVGLHSYLGHFATPTNLRAGHNTNWIAGATKNSHGQFRAKAQAAGMSTRAYANKEAGASGKLGKQARLAKTLMGMK
jgi:hypothetical protein